MTLDFFHFDELDKLVAIVKACGGEHVTVAGGAVRDSVLDKPIKDIDIFYQGELNEEAVKEFFGEKKEGPKMMSEPKVEYYLEDGITVHPLWQEYFDWEDKQDEAYENGEFSVSSYDGDSFNLNGKVIQLIKVEDVDKHIAEFSCIISRMFYSEGMLVIPKEAIRDVCLGVLSFTEDCAESYKDRISEKYNDYA